MAKRYDFSEWAAAKYSLEVRGRLQGTEINDGVPLEIPIQMQRPETLDQQIMRLVRAYSQETGQEVETIDEANDFSIPGEDEDYEEDDYIIQANAIRAGEAEASSVSEGSPETDEGTSQEAEADGASVVSPDEPAPVKKTRAKKAQ